MLKLISITSFVAVTALAVGVSFAPVANSAEKGVYGSQAGVQVAAVADTVKARIKLMKSTSKTFKKIRKLAKKAKVGPKGAAQAVAIHAAGKKFLGMFPKGTGSDIMKNRAKPEIWSDWAKFESKAKAFTKATAKMVQVTQAGDGGAIKAAVKAVRAGCKGCHKPFRGPKPKKK